jgi:hypothetical protein
VNAAIGTFIFQLECFLSAPACRIPKAGRYLASEAMADKATYQDGQNIHRYERLGDVMQERLIGTFCLLGDESTSRQENK